MRVSGKHNDLENVGPSPRHHTFFEMLGNFSFGDYFKSEAIRYAYDCLTVVYGLSPDQLYYTVHESDDDARRIWLEEIGVPPERVARMGDRTNFWQMADTGPCGPTSEIHFDFHPERGPITPANLPHALDVNPDDRFVEIWNLVFMQFNQAPDGSRTPLPAPGVDTGMGMERLTMIVQGADNSYDTDLFTPIMDRIQSLAGHTKAQRVENLTAYRVIADHTRAATFLIADGVVPGNTGRNYVTRMVIRRAGRFGSKAGFTEPFLGKVAETVIEHYGDVYPEIVRARAAILRTITDEERRFQRTVDTGVSHLMSLIEQVRHTQKPVLDGERAFDLYATYGLPLEITRDIAREHGAEVDEPGFHRAMEDHRLASGAGQAMGELGGESVDTYREVFERLRGEGKLAAEGVGYDPYGSLETEGPVLALVRDGSAVETAEEGDEIAVIIPRTPFYLEAGGQVSDTGRIVSAREPRWEISVTGVIRPAAGILAHLGQVLSGRPRLGDIALANVDEGRRWDVMRNHTATHLLHAALRAVLGEHVRQAGSLVAPDRLRFDFTHPEAMTPEEIERVERMVNDEILGNHRLAVVEKPREEAVAEGAMALFGETYGERVRTVSIGVPDRFSYELCGGTHVPETGVIGTFVVVGEGSVAAGVRRIEALTGRGALTFVQARLHILNRLAARLDAAPEALEERLLGLEEERDRLRRELSQQRERLATHSYETLKSENIEGLTFLGGIIPEADADSLRRLADRFRKDYPSGVLVLASSEAKRPLLVAAVSQDLVNRGLHAGEIVRAAAQAVGGGGGGKPTLAQAGGKDVSHLPEAVDLAREWVRSHAR
jgi:alanyl-tRNA synthetase